MINTTAQAETVAVILAAGKGTRMKAEMPKVLFPLRGKSLLGHVLDSVEAAGFSRSIVIVGYQGEAVEAEVAGRDVDVVWQREQLGTGHAAQMAAPVLSAWTGQAVVLAGDVPLIRPRTLLDLLDRHRRTRAAVTVLTAILDDATGYGRIIRDARDRVTAIVEHKDCTPVQLEVREINSSIYAFDIEFLLRALPRLDNRNRQGEYYLTDTVAMAIADQLHVEGMVVEDQHELSGINTRDQLEEAGAILERRESR